MTRSSDNSRRNMFVGHYAVSYAGKSRARSVPLWHLFVAVQFLDILWGLFVLVGVEHVRIVPGITAASPLDLYHNPYAHSLVGDRKSTRLNSSHVKISY